MMQRNLWTISNLLSISRIVLMIPVSYFLITPVPFNREIALFIILAAVATDALDGYVARIRNEISDFGKIIDPLADKISIGVVVVMLTIFGDIPWWFTSIVLGRDLIIFIAGVYVRTKTGIILPSLMSGKVTVSILALTLVFPILQYPSLDGLYQFFVVVSIALMAYSLFVYTQRFFATLNEYRR